jgi:hypothetical protein
MIVDTETSLPTLLDLKVVSISPAGTGVTEVVILKCIMKCIDMMGENSTASRLMLPVIFMPSCHDSQNFLLNLHLHARPLRHYLNGQAYHRYYSI